MNRKPLLILTVLLLFVLLVSTVGAQDSISDREIEEVKILKQEITPDGIHTVIQVPNFRDTFIASNQPDQNFGLEQNMWLGYNQSTPNYGAVRLLLQYNVQDHVPDGAVINSAKLRIYLTGVTPAGDASMNFSARYLASDWSEKTVTWNSHQPEWGSEIGIGSASSSLGWHEGDVTQMVREWMSGRKNFGFTILGDEAVRDRFRVYTTKDAQNSNASHVIVDYTQSIDTTPPVANVNSLPEWSPSNFVVRWEGYDPNSPDGSAGSGIRWYDIWESTNNGSNWNIWRAQVTHNESNFEGGEHLITYSFTAQATDNAGNKQDRGGVQAWTKVDAVAPTISMNQLPEYSSSPVALSWGGTDSGSGIASYDVQFRQEGQEWQWLFENTTLTSYVANGGTPGVTYEFRARGTDRVGNHQAWTEAQTQTTIIPSPFAVITSTDPQQILQPEDGDSFEVFWEGYTAPNTGPIVYTVHVRKPNEGWTVWIPNTQAATATYELGNDDPDGTYYFEVSARNNLGHEDPATGEPEGYIVVNREGLIQPSIWMPAVFIPGP